MRILVLAAAEAPKITDWIGAIATLGGFAVAAIAAYGAVGTLRAQGRAIDEEREARRQDVERLQAETVSVVRAAARTVILSASSRIRPMMAIDDRADWITVRATLINFGQTPILRVSAQVALKRSVVKLRLHTTQGAKQLEVPDSLNNPCVVHDLAYPVVASGAEVEWAWPGIEAQFSAKNWPPLPTHETGPSERIWFTDIHGDVNQTPDAVVEVRFTDIYGTEWVLSSNDPGGALARVIV